MEKLKSKVSNRNCIINNTLMFVLSYLIVFFVLQIGIAAVAFAYGVPMIFYTSTIDFDAVNTATSEDIWASADNVISIFGSSVVALFLLMIISVLLLTQWKTDKVQVQRFLFWTVCCCFVRIGGNFITGLLFHLWNINLVTDFMGITYPSAFGKFCFLLAVGLLLVVGFWCSSFLVKYIVDPFAEKVNESLKSMVLIPAVLGGIAVNLFFIPNRPRFIWTEVIGVAIMLAGLWVVLRPSFVKRYDFVEEAESESGGFEKEKVNKPLLFGLIAALACVKVLLDNGFVIAPSPYRNYLFENIIFIACVIIVLLFAVYLFVSYKSKKKKMHVEVLENRQQLGGEDKNILDEEWGVKKYDVSRYRDWDD